MIIDFMAFNPCTVINTLKMNVIIEIQMLSFDTKVGQTLLTGCKSKAEATFGKSVAKLFRFPDLVEKEAKPVIERKTL